MKTTKLNYAALLFFIVSIVFVNEAWAKRGMSWRGSQGWGAGSQYARLYDAKTVETVKGTVESVDLITPMKGMSSGVHLNLKTDKETIPVHLGPSWYIENQDVKIEPGDSIEVTGSRVTFNGKPAIIASAVSRGEEMLKLRDENGVPAWSGWKRR